MTPEAKHDATTQAWQALPSLAAITAWITGLTIEKWVGLVGIAFICLQAVGYLWRLRRDMRREEERLKSHQPPPVTDKGDL